MDGQTDRIVMAKMRSTAVAAVARNKTSHFPMQRYILKQSAAV